MISTIDLSYVRILGIKGDAQKLESKLFVLDCNELTYLKYTKVKALHSASA